MSADQTHGARHVAIIMDGNGRWAKKRHLPHAVGHQRGVEAVRRISRAARAMGLEALTLYAFSTENWRRPEDEVSALMGLLKRFIQSDLDEFVRDNVRLKIIGQWRALAPDIVALIEDALAKTAANTGPALVVALNYGSQDEIARAAAKAAEKGAITPEAIEAELDTADLPPLETSVQRVLESLGGRELRHASLRSLFRAELLSPAALRVAAPGPAGDCSAIRNDP
mgnify:CR=1 FL=1